MSILTCSERILFIDGIDRTGKSTLRESLVKTSGGKYYVSDRSPISQIVYSQIYNRKIDEHFFYDFLRKLSYMNDNKVYNAIIYLYAPIEILEQRYKDTNETDLDIKDYKKHIETFDEVVKEAEGYYHIRNILKFDSSVGKEQLLKNVMEKLENG